MRYINKIILNGGDSEDVNGDIIDANQLVSASFQIYFGDSDADGTVNIQASNDEYNAQYMGNFTPTHWSNIPNAQAIISGGNDPILTIANMSYRWIRATWTNTGTGVQTITVSADNTGEPNTTDITAVADVAGSLNNTYFTFFSQGNVTKYYVWYNINGAGVDPAVPSATGIMVAAATNATAAQIATATRAAIPLVASADVTTTGATTHIILTNTVIGTCTATADGAAPTGFTIVTTVPGHASGFSLASKYFFISAANAGINYYVWFKVSGVGTDPAIAGMTGVEVDITADATANAVADAVAAALDALVPFVAPNPPSNVVTVTNNASGPFTPAEDFNTGFTFAITDGGSSDITVSMMALSC